MNMILRATLFAFLTTQVHCFGVKKSSNPDLVPVIWDKQDKEKKAANHPSIKSFKDPKTNLFGFKDQNNTIILPPKYGWAYEFNIHNIADVRHDVDGKWKWYKINPLGERLFTSYTFDNGPDYVRSGLSRFEKNGKIGFVNEKGQVMVEAKYDHTTPFMFVQPVALVSKGGVIERDKDAGCSCGDKIKGAKWGLINKQGQTVIPMKFTDYKGEDHGGDHVLVLLKGEKKYKVFLNKKTGKYKAIKE